MTDKQKLTAAVLKQLAAELSPGTKVWDSDLAGYHVLAGKRGLAFRLYYRTKSGKQRVLTLGQYGICSAHKIFHFEEVGYSNQVSMATGRSPVF